MKFSVLKPEQPRPKGCVDDLRLYSIDVLVLDTFRRIPSAGARCFITAGHVLSQFMATLAGRESARDLGSHHARHHEQKARTLFVPGDIWRAVAKLPVKPRPPQVGRLIDVRIGRNKSLRLHRVISKPGRRPAHFGSHPEPSNCPNAKLRRAERRYVCRVRKLLRHLRSYTLFRGLPGPGGVRRRGDRNVSRPYPA